MTGARAWASTPMVEKFGSIFSTLGQSVTGGVAQWIRIRQRPVMPAKTRKKAVGRMRPQRQPTQFGELETTPTSHHHQSSPDLALDSSGHALPISGSRAQETQALAEAGEYDDGLNDVDLAGLEEPPGDQHGNSFWSEPDSLTRRSSPLHPGETPRAAWQFDGDGSLPPLSSPRSGRDKLPDTAPLPNPAATHVQEIPALSRMFDFSETASSICRSSPVGLGDSVKDTFDFFDDVIFGLSPNHRSDGDTTHPHLPMGEDIYDATSSPSSVRRDAESKQVVSSQGAHPSTTGPPVPQEKINKSSEGDKPAVRGQARKIRTSKPAHNEQEAGDSILPSWEGAETPAVAAHSDKGRRRKQRPKPPLQFDEVSQQFIEPPRKTMQAPRKPRMPIVSALRGSVQPSSPPAATATLPKKRAAARCTQPKKKAKTSPATAKQLTPLADAVKEDTNLEKSLAPSRPPKKRGGHAEKKDETSPCVKPGPSKPVSNATPIIVPSDDDVSITGSHAGIVTAEKGNVIDVFGPKASSMHPESQRQDLGCLSNEPGDSTLLPARSSNNMQATAVDAKITRTSRSAVRMASKHDGQAGTVGSRKILGSMDANMRSSKTTGGLKQDVVYDRPSPIITSFTKQEISEDHEKQNLTASRATRNFSVSAQGSPLPVRRQSTVKGQKYFVEPGSPGANEEDVSFNYAPNVRPQPGEFGLPAAERPLGSSINRLQPEHGTGAPRANTNAPRSSQYQAPAKESARAVPGDVQAQILASLREFGMLSGQVSRDNGLDNRTEELGRGEGEGSRSDSRDIASANLSRKLHQVVETMMKHLGTKEEVGHNIAGLYRTKTVACIEKIQNRQAKERSVLMENLRVDEDRFATVVEKAHRRVMNDSQGRDPGIRELEQTTKERHMLYEGATTSLRALHRRLLEDSQDAGKSR